MNTNLWANSRTRQILYNLIKDGHLDSRTSDSVENYTARAVARIKGAGEMEVVNASIQYAIHVIAELNVLLYELENHRDQLYTTKEG